MIQNSDKSKHKQEQEERDERKGGRGVWGEPHCLFINDKAGTRTSSTSSPCPWQQMEEMRFTELFKSFTKQICQKNVPGL